MKRFSSLLRENLHLLYYNEVMPDFQIKFCKRENRATNVIRITSKCGKFS